MKLFVLNWFYFFNKKKRNLLKIVNYYKSYRQQRPYTSIGKGSKSSFYFDPVLGIHVLPKGLPNEEGFILIQKWERQKPSAEKLTQLLIFDFILKMKNETANKIGKHNAVYSVTHKKEMEDIALKVEFLWERELEITTGIEMGRIKQGYSSGRLLNSLKLI